MLQLFFTAAFSAIPLTLYIPPPRHLSLFVGAIEEMLRESRPVADRTIPAFRRIFSWISRHVIRVRE